MDISGARVSVSSHSDLYPGTSDRVLLITGSPSAVIYATHLVWDNFAIQVISVLISLLLPASYFEVSILLAPI